MTKKSLFTRFLQLPILNCFAYIVGLIAIIHFFGYFGRYNYSHVPEEEIGSVLYKAVAPNIVINKSKPDCNYDEVLNHQKSICPSDIPKKFDDFLVDGVVNGSYIPKDCNPKFSVAVLVTYRNRQSQLDVFLPYMHNFLRRQNIHYKIYVIEQEDNKPWNKGLLYNIGAKLAIVEQFPCLILHDVDLLPLDEANLYACGAQPRHLSASIDKFRYVVPYATLVGGVLAVRADQYQALDGFSNRFEQWGGEDDDFVARMDRHGLSVLRFPRRMSRYSMIPHVQEPRNPHRGALLLGGVSDSDGYGSVRYEARTVTPHRLFTLLAVRT